MEKNIIKVVSFGCRLNALEAEVIKQHVKDIGFDMLVINSCGVTNEAERQLGQFIRKEKKANPELKIILTGCASELSRDKYEAMPEVNYIIPAIAKLDESIWENLDNLESYDLDKDFVLPPILNNFHDRQRAFVQIQTGCDQKCTYCATRLARGTAISFPPEYIIKQITAFKDYKEIALTGVNISSYNFKYENNSTPPLGGSQIRTTDLVGGKTEDNKQKDTPHSIVADSANPDSWTLPQGESEEGDITTTFRGRSDINLTTLVFLILKSTKVPRIRLSSLDIADIDDEFISLIANEPRIMPHFHFSLQSGDNTILKRMARRHTREDIFNTIKKIRAVRPESTFGADIITGFPTETEEMFKNSIDMVKKAKIAFLHVFPYSEKDNTVAAKMEQMDISLRRERAKELREVGHKVMQEYLQTRIGKKTTALIEGGFIARADDYSRIAFEGDVEVGSIQELKILEVNANNMLRGEICLES